MKIRLHPILAKAVVGATPMAGLGWSNHPHAQGGGSTTPILAMGVAGATLDFHLLLPFFFFLPIFIFFFFFHL
jgi:hypothetical protein